MSTKAHQTDLDIANQAITDNANAIAAINVSDLVAKGDFETFEAVVIDGLGSLLVDTQANTLAISGLAGASNYESLLASDWDAGGLISVAPSFGNEPDTTIKIDLSVGVNAFDFGSVA